MKISPRKITLITMGISLVITLLIRFLHYLGDTSPNLYQEILTYFTAEEFTQSLAYHRRGTTIRVVASFSHIAIFALFILTPLSQKIEAWLSSLFKSYLLSLIAFIAIYKLISWGLFIPIEYYWGFVLEHRFGFSNMSFPVWLGRSLKYLMVDSISMATTISVAFMIIKKFPKRWPTLLAGFSLIAAFGMVILYPLVITPLFYKVETLKDNQLTEKVALLANKANISVDDIYTINSGAYSNRSNAYFIGVGKKRQIVLFDKLIESHSDEEVLSVLAHEIGHWKHDHMVKGVLLGWLGVVLFLLLFSLLFPWFQRDKRLYLDKIYSPSSIPFILFVIAMAKFFTLPIQGGFSRYFEREADRVSLELYDQKVFVESHVTLAKQNKSRLNPHPFVRFWYATHPSTMERIEMGERAQKSRE